MSSFIITLMAVSLFNAVVGMISPEGDIKKYVRYLGALCLLCVMIVPVYSALVEDKGDIGGLIFGHDGMEEIDYGKIYEENLASGSIGIAEDALKAQIVKKFDIPSDSFEVKISVSQGGGDISGVEVFLHTSAIFADPRDIAAFVNEVLGCTCTVIYD